ncbi:MAG: YIP1 family protein [Acidobacteria bacterium]|nr:YIP1 family protein [Acidobacteriota bacterium]MBV9474615.1 YIP1 family protein [Acidobacteriota bacterium]
MLFAPAETFREIARRPDVIAPLLVLVIISILSSALLIPRMDFQAAVRTQMENSGRQMSSEDMERAVKMGSAVGKAIAWFAPLLNIGWFALVSGVLLLAFRLFGGEGTYKQAFSATLYSWVPLTIFGILLAVIAVSRGTVDPIEMATLVKSNPAFLVDLKTQPILFTLLGAFDVFTIWTVVLLIFGFAELAKTPKSRAAGIVISLWIVMIVIRIGFAALGAMGKKAS